MTAAALIIAGWQATTMRAADGAITTQPLHKLEEDHSSWLTSAFLVLPKMKTGKKLGSLPPITSSQFFHPLALPILHPLSFFIFSQNNIVLGNYLCDKLILLALSETMYLSAPPP
jgi:hypothetical protein